MPAQKKIPRGKFFIEDRVNANGEATIYIRYFLQRYAKRSTGINIPPKAWDEKNCCVRSSYPQASKLNLALQNFKCDIDNRLKTIYKWIWKEKRRGNDEMARNLRHHGRRKRKRGSEYSSRGQIKDRVDISLRPPEVDQKLRFGDFEIDTFGIL